MAHTTARRDSDLAHLDADECWDVLARNSIGRVGVVHRRRPQIFPVNYVVDRRSIVFRSGHGLKVMAAARSSPVVFEVDEIDPQFQRGLSVMVHGWLHEVVDPDELARLEHRSARPWIVTDRDHVLRVDSSGVTGRAIGVAGGS